MMKTKEILYRCFYGIFTFLFGFVTLKVLFGDTARNYNTLLLLFTTFVGIILMVAVYLLLKKFENPIRKYYKYILIGFLVIYGIVLLYFGFLLRFTPVFDMGAIYDGAIQWVEEGSFSNHYDYFGSFPNNLGSMSFLHFFFYIASLFGIHDYFAVGIVLNTSLFLSTVLFTSLVCKKLNNCTAGLLSLVFYMLCLPFYFISAVFYTDALSLLFPVLCYYLYLRFKEQTSWKKRIIFSVLMALSLVVGVMMKFTVIIILIAILIDAILSIHWKPFFLMAGICIGIVTIGLSGFNLYIYHYHITDKTYQDMETPYLHWIMMGLQNNGNYNPDDYVYTRSFPAEERSQACLSVIKERIHELGFDGLTRLWTNKAMICFGDGTYALSDFLDDTPEYDAFVHKYILYSGEKFSDYQHLTTGILLALYCLCVYGCAIAAFSKKKTEDFLCLAPRLAVMGILAFLLLWESNSRYFTNFIPVIIICAVLAISWKDWTKISNRAAINGIEYEKE